MTFHHLHGTDYAAFENPHPIVRWPSGAPKRLSVYGRAEPRQVVEKRAYFDRVWRRRRDETNWHRDLIPYAAVRAARTFLARLRGSHTREEWAELVARCGTACPRCLASPFWPSPDHIIPISVGGSDRIENLQPLCKTCNLGKRDERIDWLAIRGLR